MGSPWDMKQQAADRRSTLRAAFIRHDPKLSGEVAPFLVTECIKSIRIDETVPAEFVDKFVYGAARPRTVHVHVLPVWRVCAPSNS